jgi:cytochrome c oxidase subunit 2
MNSLLILIAVVAGVAAIIQLVRLNEVTSDARGNHSEEEVTTDENNVMAYGWLIFMFFFFGFTIYLMYSYGYGGLGKAASIHGEQLDWLLELNYWIILPVFFITNTLLFVFAFKYRYNKNRKASYFSHSNKLELIWTVAPSIVLAIIIFMGLKTWINIMFDAPKEGEPVVVEAYAEQFKWTFRTSGENNQLGDTDYKLICGPVTFKNSKGEIVELSGNPLGIVSYDFVQAKYAEIDSSLAQLNRELDNAYSVEGGDYFEPDEYVQEKLERIETLNVLKYRIQSGIESKINDSIEGMGADDFILPAELHLVVNRPVTFKFRSKDVIHSAWFPHFRAQMNCVPGLTTSFTFTPKYTTKEFATDPYVQAHYKDINEIHNERLTSLGMENEKVDFNFVLICNKICGAAHHNMQKNIIVETEAEYEKWYECEDFDQPVPVKPRLDNNGKPMIYKGWRKDSDEKLVNEVNMAVQNAPKEEVEVELPEVSDTLNVPAVVDSVQL